MVNQKAIAERLKVSVATVSKALSDSGDISAQTRAKVLEAASALGYQYVGRSKRKRDEETSCHYVGVLIHGDWEGVGGGSYLQGMSIQGLKLDISLVMHYLPAGQTELLLNPAYQTGALREGRLGGMILVNRWPTEVVKKLSAVAPCVSLIHEVPGVELDVVGVDETGALAMLMDQLYNLGHRRIGFFGRCGAVTWSRERCGAYVNSLSRLGLELNPGLLCDASAEVLNGKSAACEAQVDYVVRQVERGVGAWMCANNRVGYLLCRGLKDRGLRVPRDVSVTGFDNQATDPLGCPELTSVSIPGANLGAAAVERVHNRMHQVDWPKMHVKLPCGLVEGWTTAEPRAEGSKAG